MSINYKKPFTLKLVLFYSSLLHIIGGLMFVYNNDLAKLYGEVIFGMNIEINPQMQYLVKMLGLYSFLIGIIIIFVFINPYKYNNFIWVLILLYSYRFIFSILSFDFMHTNFKISYFNLYLATSILALSLILLIIGKFQLTERTKKLNA
tara:strand:+ start:1245 stop:1691 length:447 start_codon:yes stop_codon:yes gene_type:complete